MIGAYNHTLLQINYLSTENFFYTYQLLFTIHEIEKWFLKSNEISVHILYEHTEQRKTL